MRFCFERLKLVVEPSGASGLAALLAGRPTLAGRRVGVILSGANADPAVFDPRAGSAVAVVGQRDLGDGGWPPAPSPVRPRRRFRSPRWLRWVIWMRAPI